MKTITLKNDFHNTEATIRPQASGAGRWWISNATAARVRRQLCGINECKCGGNFGERPSLEAVPANDGKGWFIYAD